MITQLRLLTIALALLLQLSCMHELTVPEVDAASAPAPDAAELFQQGLTQLHNFDYDEAAASFRSLQLAYPDRVMAYWGEAMSYNHPLWFEQDRGQAQAVLNRLGETTETRLARTDDARERALLAAVDTLFFGDDDKYQRDLAYSQAMRELAERYPDDIDITALYALSLLGSSHGGRDAAIYTQAETILQSAFKRAPEHPGVLHYLIHTVDDPLNASKGLTAARVYSQIAAESPHALHMPTHIYFSLGMWQQSNELNARALQAAIQRAQNRQQGIGVHALHALHWLQYGYLQLGQDEQAMAVLQQARDYHARGDISNATLLHLESVLMLETGQWQQSMPAIEVPATVTTSRERYIADFVHAMQQVQHGKLQRAQDYRARMQQELGRLEQLGTDSDGQRVLLYEIDALVAMRAGEAARALQLIDRATALEDAMPYASGPAWPVKPAWELRGEILLEQQKYSAAVTAFETALQRFPGRRLSLLGLFTANSELCEVQASVELDVTPAL